MKCEGQSEFGLCLPRSNWNHLILTVEVEILGIDPTVEAEDIADVAWSCLREEPSSGVDVSLTKRTFRGTRKAFVRMEEARALKLLKAANIKIGWVSCRVRRKTEVKRCYRCLGFAHMAADCRGPNRSRNCWKFGEEGHTAGTCSLQQAKQEDAEVRRIAPIDNGPEIMLTRFRGHCLARKLGSFEFSGYCFDQVPHSARKCILFSPLEKNTLIYSNNLINFSFSDNL